MAMIARAEPLPAFPPKMTEARLDLTVPIRFSLR
jgi:protein TonB